MLLARKAPNCTIENIASPISILAPERRLNNQAEGIETLVVMTIVEGGGSLSVH